MHGHLTLTVVLDQLLSHFLRARLHIHFEPMSWAGASGIVQLSSDHSPILPYLARHFFCRTLTRCEQCCLVCERSTQYGNLPLHHLSAGAANRLSPFDACLEVENGMYIF